MPISSVIVRKAKSVNGLSLAERIRSLEGTSLEYQDSQHFIVIIDAPNASEERGVWDALENLEGVVGVDLVYHNYEDTCDE